MLKQLFYFIIYTLLLTPSLAYSEQELDLLTDFSIDIDKEESLEELEVFKDDNLDIFKEQSYLQENNNKPISSTKKNVENKVSTLQLDSLLPMPLDTDIKTETEPTSKIEQQVAQENEIIKDYKKEKQKNMFSTKKTIEGIDSSRLLEINFKQVFSSSPFVYGILLIMSTDWTTHFPRARMYFRTSTKS